MRLIILYDLPMVESKDVKDYNRFVKELKRIGFYRMQYSIYSKVLTNYGEVEYVKKKINRVIPRKGQISIFTMTEKQYLRIEILSGSQNKYETIVGGNELVVFERDDDFE